MSSIELSQKTLKRIQNLQRIQRFDSLDEALQFLMDKYSGRRVKPGTLCKTCADYDDCKIGRDASEFCAGYGAKSG